MTPEEETSVTFRFPKEITFTSGGKTSTGRVYQVATWEIIEVQSDESLTGTKVCPSAEPCIFTILYYVTCSFPITLPCFLPTCFLFHPLPFILPRRSDPTISPSSLPSGIHPSGWREVLRTGGDDAWKMERAFHLPSHPPILILPPFISHPPSQFP